MIVKFLDKFGKLVKSITSIGYLPVDVEPVKDSKHLLSSGAVAEIVPEGTSQSNPLMSAEDTERMIDIMKPIDAMTLRFEFSKKDYNPVVAGVGSAGTWTKVDSPTLNIWDWKNTNTDWSESFKGAFPDADNEVRVIAVGDTSSVTSMKSVFSGSFTGNPSTSSYACSMKNNVISCVPMNIEGCTTMQDMFAATHLKKFIQFDFSNNGTIEANEVFADTDIEYIGDITIGGSKNDNLFAHCLKLKKVGNIRIASNASFTNLALFPNGSNVDVPLEEVGNITGTENITAIYSCFQHCHSLKKVGTIGVSGCSIFEGMFNGCFELEELPNLIGLGDTNITSIYLMFNQCYKLKKLPYFNTSNVTNGKRAFRACREVSEIPDYDFSSITDAEQMFRDNFKVSKNIFETYEKLLARGSAITDHSRTFENCGRDTPQGRLALAQIPQSWGGLAEG